MTLSTMSLAQLNSVLEQLRDVPDYYSALQPRVPASVEDADQVNCQVDLIAEEHSSGVTITVGEIKDAVRKRIQNFKSKYSADQKISTVDAAFVKAAEISADHIKKVGFDLNGLHKRITEGSVLYEDTVLSIEKVLFDPHASLADKASLLRLMTSYIKANLSGVDQKTAAVARKGMVRPVSPGVYEIDGNPKNDKFANADLAVNAHGSLLLDYTDFYQDNGKNNFEKFNKLLQLAGLREEEDKATEVFNLFDKSTGVEVSTWDGYCRMQVHFWPMREEWAKTDQQEKEIATMLEKARLVPLTTSSAMRAMRGPGPLILSVLHMETRQFTDIVIPTFREGHYPSTFAEFKKGITER
ncbi:hypothetical protein ACFL6C_11805 [Myxococcota bacterium]